MAHDPYAAERLGDLPTAGYATRRERLISDGVMIFMRETERDRRRLLAIVIEGYPLFHSRMKRQWSGFGDPELTRNIYNYFVAQAGPNPAEQLAGLNRMDASAARPWDLRTRTQRNWDKHLRTVLADLRRERKH